jgi:hypothetical protein
MNYLYDANFMEQRPSWKVNEEIHTFVEPRGSLLCSQEPVWSLFRAWWIQFMSSHSVSLRFILILSSPACLDIPSTNWNIVYSYLSHSFYRIVSSRPPWFDHLNIWCRPQIMKLQQSVLVTGDSDRVGCDTVNSCMWLPPFWRTLSPLCWG